MKKTLFFALLCVWTVRVTAQKPVPYLQTPTATSTWVNWRTTQSTASRVYYGVSENALTQSVDGTCQIFTDPGDNYSKNYYFHGVQLTNLQPETRYFYKVVSDNTESAVYSFKTQPEIGQQGIYRFIILGDHQLTDNRYVRLIQAAKDVAESKYGTPIENHINLITNVGDQVDRGTLKQYEDVHFTQSGLLSPHLPIMTIVGNHETYGTLKLQAYANHFIYDNIEYKGIKSNTDFYYAFQEGRALFIMLSSEEEHTKETQLSWVKQIADLAKNDDTVDWIFCYNHRPVQAEQYVGDISVWVRDKVIPVLAATNKFVMDVAGHHHLYHRGQFRDYPAYHIISGGAAWDQRWGQSTEKDFDDVQKTIDYWTFQIVELNSNDKSMKVEAYVIGNEVETLSNPVLVDYFERKFNQPKPSKPSIQALSNTNIALPFQFESSNYATTGAYENNSVQFQVAASSDFATLEFDLIRDYEDIYGAHPQGCQLVDVNQGVDIFKIEIKKDEVFKGKHYIRVRHRDRNAEWSEWSDPVEFTVTNGAAGAPSVSSQKRIYDFGEELQFSYANTEGKSGQWVGVYKQAVSGARDIYKRSYCSGESGSASIQAPADKGVFYALLFPDGGYNPIARSDLFYVGSVPAISIDKTKYDVGEEITIHLLNVPGLDKDWVGIYKMGDKPGPSSENGTVVSTVWEYVSENNQLKFKNADKLSKGYYFANYMMQNDYFEPGERVKFQIGDEITQLGIGASEYKTDDEIFFYFSDGPATPKDYIGIYKTGDIPGVDALAAYVYVDGRASGDLLWLSTLPDGTYFVYLFTNDSYDAVSNKVEFTVINPTGIKKI
jgi:hypothetical protein